MTLNSGDTGAIDSMNTNASVPRVDSYENFDTLNDDDDNDHQPGMVNSGTDIVFYFHQQNISFYDAFLFSLGQKKLTTDGEDTCRNIYKALVYAYCLL